jgi:hypothetical protein
MYLVQRMPSIISKIINILKRVDPEPRGYEHQYLTTYGIVSILK